MFEEQNNGPDETTTDSTPPRPLDREDSAGSDIGLMLISDQLTYPGLLVTFSELESQLGRQINPTIYTVEEFRGKMSAENNFVLKVIEQPKIFLIGSQNDLPVV